MIPFDSIYMTFITLKGLGLISSIYTLLFLCMIICIHKIHTFQFDNFGVVLHVTIRRENLTRYTSLTEIYE